MRKASRVNPTPMSLAFPGVDQPVEVWVGGVLVAHDEHTPVSIRRARGDGQLAEPASCSFDVFADTLPDWQKGDPVEVKLSDAALSFLYGTAEAGVRTNYAMNPSVRETTLTGYYAGGGEGWTLNTNPSSYPNDGPVASGEYCLFSRTTTRTAVGAVLGGYGTPLGQPARRLKCAPGDNTVSFYVRTSHPDLVVRPRVDIQDTTSATVVAQSSPITFQIGGGAWHRVHQSFFSPSALTDEGRFELVVESASRDFQSGDSFGVTGALGEWVDVLAPWFDGSGPNTEELTHAWMPGSGSTGTSALTAYSTETSSAVAVAKAQGRYRFRGVVSDLDLDGDRTAPARVSITATSGTAKLGETYLGAEPWPVEGLSARAARVIAAAELVDPELDLTAPVLPGNIAPVRATDVDRRSVADLLVELAETAGPGTALIERRDGSVLFATDLDAELPPCWLSYEVIRNRLGFSRTDRVNDVALRYGPEQGPVAGTVLRRNLALNPSFEAASAWVFTGPVPTYDTTTKVNRTRSVKIVTTAVAVTSVVQDVAAVAGQRATMSGYIRCSTLTGAWKFALLALNGSNVELGRVEAALPGTLGTSGEFVRLSVHYPSLPVGTTKVRMMPVSLPTLAVAGETIWADAVLLELDADPEPGTYFDGTTTDGEAYAYQWVGGVEATASTMTSTGRTPRYERRVQDAAALLTDRRAQATVDTILDVTADPTYTTARAEAAMSSGEWTLPELVVDLMPLLDGRVSGITDPVDALGPVSPKALVGRVLRAEVGSQSRVSTFGEPGTEWPHLPAVNNVTGNILSLHEQITAARWLITTTNERTTP